MPISAVLFDIGNVLVNWDPDQLYSKILAPEDMDALLAEVDIFGANDAIDRGAPFEATIFALADQHPEHAGPIRAWVERWDEMFTPVIDHSVRLQRALRKKGVPVFALSNFGDDSFTRAEGMYPFLTEFDRRYISGRMRVMKPEAEIYAQVEADCGLAPETLLFVDDRADNIAAAKSRGWQTHHFDGPAPWAARLVAEGLLTEAEAR